MKNFSHRGLIGRWGAGWFSGQDVYLRPKKKERGLFPVSRPTLFFGADPKLFFFNFEKKIQNKRRKIAKKSSKSVVTFAGCLFY